MTDNWKSLLPEKYVRFTKCHHVIKQYSSKGINAEIVICTIQGYVLEFFGLRIVGYCEIPSIDPKRIMFFTSDVNSSYFYIVESNEDIIILNKKKELQVMKHYENVKRSIISDFSNSGYPQLGIWTSEATYNETPDIIVNLHEGDRTTSADCSISHILKEKYEELKMKVKDHEQKLKLKKELRIYNSEVMDHTKKLHSTTGLEFIQLIGQYHGEIDPKVHLQQKPVLQVAETWQRMHNNKWVIGIVVCNVGQTNLQDLHLILKSSDEEKLSYVSKLIMYNKDEISAPKHKKLEEDWTEGMAGWKQISVLESRRKTTLIGVLSIPKFVNTSAVKISALITYRCVGEMDLGYQVPVSSFQYCVGDHCRKIGSPFSSEVVSEADLLCVLMSSITITVRLVYNANFEPSLRKILVEDLKFVEISQLGCLYHKGTCVMELAGLMLHVDQLEPLKYQISISGRDIQQIYLLVNCIYNVLFAPLILILPPQLPTTKEPEGVNYQHLQEELELVLNCLKHWVVEKQMKFTSLEPDVQMPYAEYLKFRAQLSALELKTDISTVSNK